MRAYFDKSSKIQETVVSTGNKDYIKTIKETLWQSKCSLKIKKDGNIYKKGKLFTN